MAQQAPSSTRQVRIWVIVGLLAAVTAVLVTAYFLMAKRDMAVLAANLRPEEAAAIAQELDAEAVPYEVSDGGTTLLVAAEERDTIRLKIAGADLPIKGQEGFELFDSSELGLTEFAQRIKYQRALQGELARTIMRIDGVLEARIHISIPEQSVFKSERSPAKAAVTLLTRSPDVETPDAIAGIQQLVASSIPDLNADDVVVLNGHGAVISARISRNEPPTHLAELEAAIHAVAPGSTLAVMQQQALPTPPASGTAGGDAPGVALAPATVLLVTTPSPLEQADKDRVVSLAVASGLAGISSAANVRFNASVPIVNAPVVELGKPSIEPASQPHTKASSPQIAQDNTGLMVGLAAGVIALLLLSVLAVVGIRQRQSRLSLTEQRRFAEQLRLGLQGQSKEVQDAI